jgi:hypothetical protein
VALTPTVFLPFRAIGQPWDWIGVGVENPHFSTCENRDGKFDANQKRK